MNEHCIVMIFLGITQADIPSRVVPGDRFQHSDKYAAYFKQTKISPAAVRDEIEKFIKANGMDESPYLGQLEGILDEEFVFNDLGSNHKRGFVIYGYRVNTNNGAVRFVTRKDAAKEFGGAFVDGYIPRRAVQTYLPKPQPVMNP